MNNIPNQPDQPFDLLAILERNYPTIGPEFKRIVTSFMPWINAMNNPMAKAEIIMHMADTFFAGGIMTVQGISTIIPDNADYKKAELWLTDLENYSKMKSYQGAIPPHPQQPPEPSTGFNPTHN